MLLVLFIETSVMSYLVARPSRDPVTAWRQQLTKDWWAEQRGQFACVISQEVIAEMVGTTRSRVNLFMNKFKRMGFIDGLTINPSLMTVVHE